MGSCLLTISLVLLGAAGPSTSPETASDAVTLRDGAVVLGQVVEPSPRGALMILVRRKWAEEELPEWARRWQAAELPALRQARTQRRERLTAWRRERAAEGNDPITAWIDRELARLGDDDAPPRSRLMMVRLSRGDVRTIVRRPRTSARMLRQGWLAGFPSVETMPLESLKGALEGRGFSLQGREPVAIDRLLPIAAESDAQWLARRAATEVTHDSGLRFVGTQDLFFTELAPGELFQMAGPGMALAQAKRLLNQTPPNPLAGALHTVAARGRVGAVVTRLDISPDLAIVRAAATLWVRRGADRWVPFGTRSFTVRPDRLGPNAGAPLADDPQVQAAFRLVEALGLGPIPDEIKQRSLHVGAATQQALRLARTALNDNLAALAFPIDEPAIAEEEAKSD